MAFPHLTREQMLERCDLAGVARVVSVGRDSPESPNLAKLEFVHIVKGTPRRARVDDGFVYVRLHGGGAPRRRGDARRLVGLVGLSRRRDGDDASRLERPRGGLPDDLAGRGARDRRRHRASRVARDATQPRSASSARAAAANSRPRASRRRCASSSAPQRSIWKSSSTWAAAQAASARHRPARHRQRQQRRAGEAGQRMQRRHRERLARDRRAHRFERRLGLGDVHDPAGEREAGAERLLGEGQDRIESHSLTLARGLPAPTRDSRRGRCRRSRRPRRWSAPAPRRRRRARNGRGGSAAWTPAPASRPAPPIRRRSPRRARGSARRAGAWRACGRGGRRAARRSRRRSRRDIGGRIEALDRALTHRARPRWDRAAGRRSRTCRRRPAYAAARAR